MVINGAQETYWALFFHMWFSLLWKSPDPSPLDGNTVTIAAKCYEDNCHYVALIRIECHLAQRAYEYNNM